MTRSDSGNEDIDSPGRCWLITEEKKKRDSSARSDSNDTPSNMGTSRITNCRRSYCSSKYICAERDTKNVKIYLSTRRKRKMCENDRSVAPSPFLLLSFTYCAHLQVLLVVKFNDPALSLLMGYSSSSCVCVCVDERI